MNLQLSYPNRQQVLVVGYPRSGNTHLARLLGDILNAPVTGAYNATPLAQEGLDRNGPYVVRQLHLRPLQCEVDGPALRTGWCFCENLWKDERIVQILRDPRDIAVSAFHYWERPSINDTLKSMISGLHPLKACGPWSKYIDAWIDVSERSPLHSITTAFYEDLINAPAEALTRVLTHLNIEGISHEDIERAIERQSFSAKRKQVELDGNERPYGSTIQLKHMRKGIIGDWRNHFTRLDCELAAANWQAQLQRFRYEPDVSWINSI